jgi:hypothetical protein
MTFFSALAGVRACKDKMGLHIVFVNACLLQVETPATAGKYL